MLPVTTNLALFSIESIVGSSVVCMLKTWTTHQYFHHTQQIYLECGEFLLGDQHCFTLARVVVMSSLDPSRPCDSLSHADMLHTCLSNLRMNSDF